MVRRFLVKLRVRLWGDAELCDQLVQIWDLDEVDEPVCR